MQGSKKHILLLQALALNIIMTLWLVFACNFSFGKHRFIDENTAIELTYHALLIGGIICTVCALAWIYLLIYYEKWWKALLFIFFAGLPVLLISIVYLYGYFVVMAIL